MVRFIEFEEMINTFGGVRRSENVSEHITSQRKGTMSYSVVARLWNDN